MLENINPDIVILVLIAAIAGALSSIVIGKVSQRRIDRQRQEWEQQDQDRVDEINQHLNGGRDA